MNSQRTFRIVTICIPVLLFGIGLALTPGCKKDQTATTTVDSSKTSSNAAGTNQTATTDTSHAVAAQISGPALEGQKIFYDASAGKRKVACAGCHLDGQPTTKDTRIRPGATLVGVVSRASTWNGLVKGADLKKMAYGGSICAMLYQERAADVSQSLSAAQVSSLNAYFDAIKNGPDAQPSAIKVQWVVKPAFSDSEQVDTKLATAAGKDILKLAGDPGSGQAVYARTCQYCHSIKDKKIGPPMKDAFKQIDNVARVLRVGSAAMPFYAKNILSDQQLADVIAYVQGQLGK